MDKKVTKSLLLVYLSLLLLLPSCALTTDNSSYENIEPEDEISIDISDESKQNLNINDHINSLEYLNTNVDIKDLDIEKYNGSPYFVINDNVPFFTETEKKNTEAFEEYSPLDDKGRCGIAAANICCDIMPTEERGSISNIKPTGWHSNMGWQRCHLIGYQLAGENANNRNLITGTQYMNVSGMLPFENMVDDYIEETNNHVLYRVTPYFEDNNLIASGVEMEAWSVEDNGSGICFNVFCYNVSKSAKINYKTGIVTNVSKQSKNANLKNDKKAIKNKTVYWTESGTVYHLQSSCSTLKRSKQIYKGTIAESGKIRACKKCF